MSPASRTGLTNSEVEKRREKYGPNLLPEKPPPSSFSIFLSQLKNPFVYVLLAAFGITFFLKEYSDSAIIFLAVFVNTILGYVQEKKASKAFHELKKLVHPSAKVMRDGKQVEIDAKDIVPGDIVLLDEGGKIPADGVLVYANRLFIKETILTGEAVPVSKEEGKEVFMGTSVSAGKGMMEVVSIGKDTKMGAIALSIQEKDEETPLKKQIKSLSRQLSLFVFVLTFLVFVVGVIKGLGVEEMFITSVSLAVSAIPEGLLVGLTVVLAIGMQRVLQKKGLVRNLLSAETLGGVSVICTDKTGTLTLGKMKVAEIVGDENEIAFQMFVANDIDDPIVVAAYEWAKGDLKIRDEGSEKEKYPRIDSLPFNSDQRFFASLNKVKGKSTLFVNGAPEIVLEWTNLGKKEKAEIQREIDIASKKGLRLLGLARKEVSKKETTISPELVKGDLTWIGLLAFSDPIREGVKEALVKTTKAGIRTIVITGDYKDTSVYMMEKLEIKVTGVISGQELAKLGDEELADRLKKGGANLFVRTSPNQKLKIVEALKRNGEVVAMMGDGVNDAPALKKADIGVVVGEASDVSRETADLVLLDSSFGTIVSAVEEGRGIFDNIRKIILYLLSDAFAEIVAVIGTLAMSLPLPLSPAQILWINIVSDGFPDLALTVDPKESDIMDRRPRSYKETIVSPRMRGLILLISFIAGLIGLGAYVFVYKTTNDETLARSVAFAVLGLNSLSYVFSIKLLHKPFWKENPLTNKWLNLAVLLGLGFQFLPFLVPSLGRFLKITMLPPDKWGIVVMASLAMFITVEVAKDVSAKLVRRTS